MGLLPFQESTLRFRHAAMMKVRVIPIRSPSVTAVLESCHELFNLQLDRSDTFQADLSRKIWYFRAHILFTLLPFDSMEIQLGSRLEEIIKMARNIPSAIDAAARLETAMNSLLEHPENPKHHWITTEDITVGHPTQLNKTALLAMMAMGKTFGFPKTPEGFLVSARPVEIIDSRKGLVSAIFDRIVIPGTCHYLSGQFFTKLFYEGRSKTIDVLVYSGERFSLRQRLTLPASEIFRGKLTSRPITCTQEVTSETHDTNTIDIDAVMKDSFWKLAHDGAQSPNIGLVSARYVLFRNSHGLFVPSNANCLVWRETPTDDFQLMSIQVERIAEGDWLMLLSTDAGYLLDQASAEAGFGEKCEEVCDWRPALESLFRTVFPKDIAEEMRAEGAHGVVLAQSLQKWADGTVYGPGDKNELRALLTILIRHGKLPTTTDFDQYVANHWKGLQELRGIRHRAGHDIRSDIYHQLSKALGKLGHPTESQSVRLENGVTVHLDQVAALDDQTSWVRASRLMHLQPMKGGRWHE